MSSVQKIKDCCADAKDAVESKQSPRDLSIQKIKACCADAEDALESMGDALNNQSPVDSVYTITKDLLEKLTLLINAAADVKVSKGPIYTILQKWSQYPQGWFVLVNSMCTDLNGVQLDMRSGMIQLFDLMVQWIAKQHQADDYHCAIWNVAPWLLAALCGYNTAFCTWYINALARTGDGLDIYLKHLDRPLWDAVVTHATSPDLVSRLGPLSSVGMMIMKEVVVLEVRLSQLSKQGGPVKGQTLNMLIDRIRKKSCNLWSYIGALLYRRLGLQPQGKRDLVDNNK
ncbi:hypothetical protein ACOMHN_007507 [Nucella lapillus]